MSGIYIMRRRTCESGQIDRGQNVDIRHFAIRRPPHRKRLGADIQSFLGEDTPTFVSLRNRQGGRVRLFAAGLVIFVGSQHEVFDLAFKRLTVLGFG